MTVTYTVGNLIDDTIHQLLGSTRLQLNVLNTTMNNTDVTSTIAFQQPIQGVSGITPGSYIEIDQEEMYVISVNTSTQSILVQRAIPTSVISTHSIGTLVYINSPFPRWSVAKHLRDELRSWGPQVFQVATESLSLQPGVYGYDLGSIAPFFRVLSVRQQTPNPTGIPNNEAWPVLPFEVDQSADTTAFPSGKALILGHNFQRFINVDTNSPLTLHVSYAKPFDVDTAWLESTDCISAIGLDTSDLDIPPLGAAARMMAFREVRRTMTELQGEPRDAMEVAALFITRTAAAFKTERNNRLNDAAFRLLQQYPVWMSN